jgi:hypothetical protein
MPSELIAVHKINKNLWENLRLKAAIYMSKCLPDNNKVILDEKKLLSKFEESKDDILNITPNGMIVPKRHLILEYNGLVKAFIDIINSLNIQDFILSWHIPLNLRIKFTQVNQENLTRHHPTEDIHSDSWAGESSESVTTYLPIFGDISKNYVQTYDPPDNFKENWLGPLPTYKDGIKYASQYSKVDLIQKPGDLMLADFATLHSSTRLKNAKTRVSIDTTFHMKRTKSNEVIHKWREGERTSNEILSMIGEKNLFVFPDEINNRVDSKGGFKHPTNLKIVKFDNT